MTEQLLPPASWYADPEGSGRWRYWDGAAWTEVYLNQSEPGPSVLAQWWERVRPGVFLVSVVGVGVSIAINNGLFPFFVCITVLSLPDRQPKDRLAHSVAFFGAIVVGVTVAAGWRYGFAMTGCAGVAALVARYRQQIPTWVAWPVTAFALVGFGVIWFTGVDPWRG